MPWTAIAANETDANSPLNQTLMDKIRDNLDFLYALLTTMGSYVINLNGTDAAGSGWGGGAGDWVLDDSIDWRDRYINIRGNFYFGTAAQVAALIPGGGLDTLIHNQIGTHPPITTGTSATNCNGYALINDWLYSEDGGANRTTEPYLSWTITGTGSGTLYIWVDSTDGKLWAGGSGWAWDTLADRRAAWNLQITYSEDLGGV